MAAHPMYNNPGQLRKPGSKNVKRNNKTTLKKTVPGAVKHRLLHPSPFAFLGLQPSPEPTPASSRCPGKLKGRVEGLPLPDEAARLTGTAS